MRLKCLSCEALARLAYWCAAQSPHLVDVEMLRIGLHNTPFKLCEQLQAKIDDVSGEDYDAVALAYGLCGQATAGLTARDIPVVIPRAHDCITLFLGSRARYQEEFEKQPGTYWYTADYIERKDRSGAGVALGSGVDHSDLQSVYQEYVEKYGKDNADYLMEVMGAWQSHYRRAVFIDIGIGDTETVETQSLEEAARRGWEFEHMAGDPTLIYRLLAGEWEEDFLVLSPGEQIAMSYDHNVVCATRHGRKEDAP